MNETIEAIKKELTVCYIAAHKTVPSSAIDGIAAAVADAVPTITADNAHDIFRRAVQVEAVPTIPAIVTAARNHNAETYSKTSSLPLIENRNPREPWLPSDTIGKRINLCNAIRNYCAAVSDALYMEYCKVHTRHRDGNGKPVFDRPERVEAFEAPIKETIRDLYRKYWRKCACAAGYPEDAPFNLGLSAPTVTEFRAMLAHESHA
jgi:hypothetical protein